jgi:glutamyl-tRNA synthetase
VNFLALLGWSPGSGDEEVFSRDELVARFSLEGISGGNAVFNPEKLDWFNQQHLLRMPLADVVSRIQPQLAEAGLWRPEYAGARRDWLERVVDLVRPRVRRLNEFVDQLRPFLGRQVARDPKASATYLEPVGIKDHLRAWRDRLGEVEPFDAATVETALRQLAAERGVKAGVLIHATRVAVTGQSVSPGVFDVVALAGRDLVRTRIDEVLGS